MKILQSIQKVPGGLMVVPLFIGMLLNTLAPDAMKIGGFTQALTNVGYPTFLAMYLFTVGTKMTLNAAPTMLKRGFGIMFAKVGTAVLVALAVAHFFDGDVFGLTTLAVLAAMKKEPWADTFYTLVEVKDGTVEFHGFMRTEAVRRGLRVLAENTPGVKGVVDKTEMMPTYLYAAA